MRRWFRRKGQDNDQDEENGSAPLIEETEPAPEAAASPEPAGEAEIAAPEPEAPETAPLEAVTDAVPCGAGFWGRWRREAQPEEELWLVAEEGAAESEAVFAEPPPAPLPEPPPPPEPEPERRRNRRRPSPPPPSLSQTQSRRKPGQRRRRPFSRQPRTWRRPGRSPKTPCAGECFAACGNGSAGPGMP